MIGESRSANIMLFINRMIFIDIPVLLEAAAVLATFVHPNHIVIYAHGASLTYRLPATPSTLGIVLFHSIESSKV